jgi:hypothetical protein
MCILLFEGDRKGSMRSPIRVRLRAHPIVIGSWARESAVAIEPVFRDSWRRTSATASSRWVALVPSERPVVFE